jgi:hypothetical protein
MKPLLPTVCRKDDLKGQTAAAELLLGVTAGAAESQLEENVSGTALTQIKNKIKK